MTSPLIPPADTLPLGWGWFQALLLLTFPLHLLAMNVMLGGLMIGLWNQLWGGEVQQRFAHRIALVTPLSVASAVNLGVAPFLFLQVLYGQFIYTSSVLMALGWIMVIPLLIVAYRATYLYDFHFQRLGRHGLVVGGLAAVIFLVVAALFSHNMLLMSLPERFAGYFQHMDGTLNIADENTYLFRYLHMVLGSLAVGGLGVGLLGRFQANRDPEMADYAVGHGLMVFTRTTVLNLAVGTLFLLSLPRGQMLVFMGRDMAATIAFCVALLLVAGSLVAAFRRRLWLTIGHVVPLVFVMTFLRSWLRAGYLHDYFTLDRLPVMEQYSPMIFFIITLIFGLCCLGWLWKTTAAAMARG